MDYLITARGRKLDYAYEPWGPIKEEQQYPTTAAGSPDRTLTYGYDDDGNLTSVTDDGVQAGAMYVTTYDSLGRAFDETVKYLPGGDRVLEHRYDRFGNRKELTLQDGGTLVHSYSYNKLNQLASASLVGAAVSASYFATNELQTLTLPNGVSRSYSYKPNGPLDTITVTGSTGPLAQYAYSYDDVLNVDTLTDPDGLHDYGYDGINRLTTAIRPAGLGLPNESYAYDRVGNREDPGNAALYSYDNNNRISASPALTYTFDADGSLATRSDGATFSHDPRNRLVQYTKSGTTASYLHDPLGRRIQKTVNGAATWFLWDGSQLLAEYSAAGARQQRYAYLEGYAPAQVEDANGVYYLHADHLDTPRLLTNAAGQIAWRARYEAFGKATVENDPDANGTPITLNLRFPGQYFDAETGLHQNYFRDYAPEVGRYVQSDPIGLSGGLNTFAYAGGRPTVSSDAQGLVPNPLEGACVLGPNPVCTGGVLIDIATTVGPIIVGGVVFSKVVNIEKARKARDASKEKEKLECPSNNDNGCKRAQEQLLMRRLRLNNLRPILSGIQYARAAQDYNMAAAVHNSRCREYPVALLPLS